MKDIYITKKSVYIRIWIFFGFIGIIFFGYNTLKYKMLSKEVEKNILSTTNLQEAYFAAWCFWCAESSFEHYKKDGIIDVISGYAWWSVINPTYKQVSQGNTWHRETVKVLYDADKIQYEDLLQIFWRTADPTDAGGQYVDRWFQYTSAIFYSHESEKQIAKKSLRDIQESWRFWNKMIVTPIIKYTNFYKAEDYHQDYYIKNPVRYNVYTNSSGRKEFLWKIWWKDLYYKVPSSWWKRKKVTMTYTWAKLSPLQYKVTQEKGTEKPFNNKYWDNTKEGIYVDLIDGTPLYSSKDKYKSWTGWPSFTKAINMKNIEEREDRGLFTTRTEIIGAKSKAHIWHVFTDGPIDSGGLRYCMNSAALDFIPKEDLEKKGYWEYLSLFY